MERTSRNNSGKRPLGSRAGMLRAQKLNAELAQKRAGGDVQRAVEAPTNVAAGPRRVTVFHSETTVTGITKGATTKGGATGGLTTARRAEANAEQIARTDFERRVLEQRRQRAAAQKRSAQRAAQGSARSAQRPAQSRVAQPAHRVAASTTARRPARSAAARSSAMTRAEATARANETAEAEAAARARAQARRAQENLRRPVMVAGIEQRPLGARRDLAEMTVADLNEDDSPDEMLELLPSDFADKPQKEPKEEKRSPFLQGVKVEKRALSRRLYHNEDIPTEVFDDFGETDQELVPAEEPTPRKRSVWPLIGLLLLTVILGAAVGAVVYLCIFQEF